MIDVSTLTSSPSRTVSSSPRSARPPLGRPFLIVWSGQTVSAVGSSVSGVGTAVFVFLQTGSAVWLGVLTALATLPTVLAAPLMTLVDRYPRRTVMIAGDTVAAIGPVVALVLAAVGQLQIWHLGAAALLGGIGSAFQAPAAQAAIPLLVRPEALGRANGLGQLGPAVGIVIGPLLAAPLVAMWGIEAVLVVDVVTFAVAVSTLAVVPMATDHRPGVSGRDERSWEPARVWLAGPGRPARGLMALGAVVNAMLALFNVAIVALAASIGGASGAGLPIAAIGVALVAGSVLAGVRGVDRDRMRTFACGLGAMALGCAVVAARPSVIGLAVGGALAVVMVPAVNAASATLFQEWVPSDLQGRVFGVRAAIGGALYPVASALAGVLIAEVGAPLIAEHGLLAGTLGRAIGTGPERGAAVVVLAAGLVLGSLGWWLSRSELRRQFAAMVPDAPLPGTPPPAIEG